MNQVLVFLVCAPLLYAVWHHFKLKATCRYCGEQWGHDVHCPYKDVM